MATTVSSVSVGLGVSAQLTSGTTPAIASCSVQDQTALSPAIGTATNNVNAVYSASLTLTSGSNNDIDVSSLTDPLGNAINFAKLYGYKLTNNGTTGQTITVGGASTNPIIGTAESSEPVQALGSARAETFVDGGLTVDGSHKTIRLTAAGGGTVAYVLTILGHT